MNLEGRKYAEHERGEGGIKQKISKYRITAYFSMYV